MLSIDSFQMFCKKYSSFQIFLCSIYFLQYAADRRSIEKVATKIERDTERKKKKKNDNDEKSF